MSDINITVEGGTSKRLLTAGKYCDRDILVTATGSGGSGGGGTLNMGSCTVVIKPAGNTNHYVYREVVNSDDTIGYKLSRSYTSSNISQSARCDSNFVVMTSNVKSATATGGEILAVISGQGVVFKTPATAGESVQITLGA